MFNEVKKTIKWGDETLTLETGKIARQADSCVLATLGETTVMAAVTFAKKEKPGQDFFPLTVHYQEKYYAAGKIPGGFFKREARPSEKETLTARLIDRPIRPLFVPGFKNEVLVMNTVLSHDLINDSQIGYNLGYNKYSNYNGELIYTIEYGRSLGSFGVFFELFGNESSNNSSLNFDSGIIYLIDNDKQLDLSIGRGLNNDMFYVSAGFSIDIY